MEPLTPVSVHLFVLARERQGVLVKRLLYDKLSQLLQAFYVVAVFALAAFATRLPFREAFAIQFEALGVMARTALLPLPPSAFLRLPADPLVGAQRLEKPEALLHFLRLRPMGLESLTGKGRALGQARWQGGSILYACALPLALTKQCAQLLGTMQRLVLRQSEA